MGGGGGGGGSKKNVIVFFAGFSFTSGTKRVIIDSFTGSNMFILLS